MILSKRLSLNLISICRRQRTTEGRKLLLCMTASSSTDQCCMPVSITRGKLEKKNLIFLVLMGLFELVSGLCKKRIEKLRKYQRSNPYHSFTPPFSDCQSLQQSELPISCPCLPGKLNSVVCADECTYKCLPFCSSLHWLDVEEDLKKESTSNVAAGSTTTTLSSLSTIVPKSNDFIHQFLTFIASSFDAVYFQFYHYPHFLSTVIFCYCIAASTLIAQKELQWVPSISTAMLTMCSTGTRCPGSWPRYKYITRKV